MLVGADPEAAIERFMHDVVDLTKDHVCAYKIQKAFFDLYPLGFTALKNTIRYINDKSPETCVIVDCKIGDTENTMRVYFESLFNNLRADGIVLNPYMGFHPFSALRQYPGKAGVILVRTSNGGSEVVQEKRLANDQPFWRHILELVVEGWNTGNVLIPIVSSNSVSELADMRRIIPDQMPVFLAGVGAQGGDIHCVPNLLDSAGRGVIINSSRGILYPFDRSDPNWRTAIQKAVVDLKTSVNRLVDYD